MKVLLWSVCSPWTMNFVENFLIKHNYEVWILSIGNNRDYMNKPVWSMSAVPFNKSDVGIIIAINPIIWNQLMDVLEKMNSQIIYVPFCLKLIRK